MEKEMVTQSRRFAYYHQTGDLRETLGKEVMTSIDESVRAMLPPDFDIESNALAIAVNRALVSTNDVLEHAALRCKAANRDAVTRDDFMWACARLNLEVVHQDAPQPNERGARRYASILEHGTRMQQPRDVDKH